LGLANVLHGEKEKMQTSEKQHVAAPRIEPTAAMAYPFLQLELPVERPLWETVDEEEMAE
jgi:hypothetical protein